MEYKTCRDCSTEKHTSEFYKQKECALGVRPECKACVKARIMAKNAENPEPNRAKVREWKLRNPGATYANIKKHRALNPEKHNTESRLYKRRNREKCAATAKLWSQNNRDKTRAKYNRYRSAKLKALPTWANHERIAEFYFAADFLGMVTGEWYHVDHQVPLQSKLVCGLHCESNLQVLPGSENQAKANRYWPDMP